MLKVLLRLRLQELLWVFTGAHRKKKAQSKGMLIAFAGLMLYALAALGFLFWHIFDTIALPFQMAGLGWLYYAMAALMAFALMFVGSVFAAKSQLYEAKDNDLLLSMPIKPGHVLLSRMFILWVLDFVIELAVAVPAVIAAEGLSGRGSLIYIAVFALLPLLVLAVSALFGWMLSAVTGRFGNSPLLTMLLSVAFLGAYMLFSFKMNIWLGQLAQNPDGAAKTLGAVALLYWIGAAIAGGNWSLFLRAAALMLGSFALVYVILSATFIRIATGRRSLKKKKYTGRAQRMGTPQSALFQRELRRLLSSPGYMLNGAMGSIFALIAAAVLLIKGGDLTAMPVYDLMAPMLRLMAIMAACFFAAMALVTAPSVSLEGKTLWIARSAPVEAADVLRAKLRLHLAVSVPPVLAVSCAAVWVLRTGGILLLGQLLLPALFCLFTGLLGLMENLRHPSFDWVNETQAVKSSMSVLLTMLISWGVLVIPVLVYVPFGDFISPELICAVFLAAVAVLCLLLYRWLMSRGAKIYEEL